MCDSEANLIFAITIADSRMLCIVDSYSLVQIQGSSQAWSTVTSKHSLAHIKGFSENKRSEQPCKMDAGRNTAGI